MDKASTYIDIFIGIIIASGIQYLSNVRIALSMGADWRELMNPTIDISALMFLIAVIILFVLIILRGRFAKKESKDFDVKMDTLINKTVTKTLKDLNLLPNNKRNDTNDESLSRSK